MEATRITISNEFYWNAALVIWTIPTTLQNTEEVVPVNLHLLHSIRSRISDKVAAFIYYSYLNCIMWSSRLLSLIPAACLLLSTNQETGKYLGQGSVFVLYAFVIEHRNVIFVSVPVYLQQYMYNLIRLCVKKVNVLNIQERYMLL